MIKKIISGGQTGADRAALDTAIKLRIPHGGWVPRSRMAEDGPISDKYQLQEMTTENYAARTEKNVQDSDGTLIISHGPLTGGSDYTRKMAMKHGKNWLHTDLNKLPTFQAAMVIEDWISKNDIENLNVAGPRASQDPQIYGLVTVILELLYNLQIVKNHMPQLPGNLSETEEFKSADQPKTVDEAVSFLTANLSLKDKSTIAKMTEDDLGNLNFSLGLYIRNRLLYPRNEKLLESCRRKAVDKYLHWDQAPAVIIKRLWEKLRRTHKLRVVK
jgi:hypothetical protein